jgi:hypothetical protein
MSSTPNAIVNNQQLNLFAKPGTLIPKLIHAGTDWVGQPYVYTDDSSVALRSKIGRGVIVDNIFGTTINGPIAFLESLENIHVGGGYWTINPTQLESIGSSASIPVPWLVPSTPRLLYAAQTVKSSVSLLQAADPSISSAIGL